MIVSVPTTSQRADKEPLLDLEKLEAATDNLLSFFTLLMEADRRAGSPILNDTIYGRLSPEDVEYMLT